MLRIVGLRVAALPFAAIVPFAAWTSFMVFAAEFALVAAVAVAERILRLLVIQIASYICINPQHTKLQQPNHSFKPKSAGRTRQCAHGPSPALALAIASAMASCTIF
jgi:hypothetical protein